MKNLVTWFYRLLQPGREDLIIAWEPCGVSYALCVKVVPVNVSSNSRELSLSGGRSIEIYRFDESPSLVTSVANVFYGTNKYEGYKFSRPRNLQGNPLLVSCDLNPWFPEEMTMLDENNILTFVDFARG